MYAATVKSQLATKGDNGYYADLCNVVVLAGLPLAFPLTAWLMHYRGIAATLVTAQTLFMAFLAMQVGS